MDVQRLMIGISLFACAMSPAIAAQHQTQFNPLSAGREINELSRILKESSFRHNLGPILSRAERLQNEAKQCLDKTQSQLQQINNAIKPLARLSGTTYALSAMDRSLKDQRATVQLRQSRCQMVLTQSQSLIHSVQGKLRSNFAEALSRRGQPLPLQIAALWRSKQSLWRGAKIATVKLWLGDNPLRLVYWVLGLAILGLVMGWSVVRFIWPKPKDWPERTSPLEAIILSLGRIIRVALPWIGMSIGPICYGLLAYGSPRPLIVEMLFAYGIWLGGIMILYALAGVYLPSDHPVVGLADRPSVRRLGNVAWAVTIIGAWAFFTPFAEFFLPAFRHLLLGLWLTLIGIMVAIVLFRLPRLEGRRTPFVTRLSGITVIAAIIAYWLGYQDLGRYLEGGAVSSYSILFSAWLIGILIRDFFDGIDNGDFAWQRIIRRRLRLREGETMAGGIWLRLLLQVCLWGGAGLILIAIWSPAGVAGTIAIHYLLQGFQIGTVSIVPVQWAIAIALFGVLLTLGSRIGRRLESQLIRARVERGKREAVVRITEYSLWILAGVVALAFAGFKFRNLALIAGALSVGIGFGLQNIVNNFISGIILLFERPVRPGDWVVIGNTEGYVRRISIRSTLIETFDKAEVLVPNSELISQQVTNWMLSSQTGRITVPVGVAYGSNTSQVKSVLLEIAKGHQAVVKGSEYIPDPVVLFRGFGDSALNFELRCFIRDVQEKLLISSDLNFSIDQALREAGIEIPFPQRDLHVRSVTSDWPADRPKVP